MWGFPRISNKALSSTRRCQAIVNKAGFRCAASAATSARFSLEKRQRLTELRQKIDAEKAAQLKSKQDEEKRDKRLRRFDMSWIKDALWGFRTPPMMELELAQRAVIRGIRYNDGFAQ